MKKLVFITIVAGIFTAQINSQAQGLYAGAEVGYGFASQAQPSYANISSSGSTSTLTSESYSLGTGMAIGLYGGYMITKNIGFELNISDKFSSSNTATNSNTNVNGTITDVYTEKGGLFRLTPGIRFAIGDGKLQPYTVTGLIIGFPSATLEDNETTTTITPAVTTTSDEIGTYSGGIIIGFHSAIGVVYALSDKIGIFGELSGNFQNWAPSQLLITTDTYNGANELGTLTTNEKQTNYVSSYTTTAYSPGSPTQSAKVYLPFSSFGINIGIHINLGGASSFSSTTTSTTTTTTK